MTSSEITLSTFAEKRQTISKVKNTINLFFTHKAKNNVK